MPPLPGQESLQVDSLIGARGTRSKKDKMDGIENNTNNSHVEKIPGKPHLITNKEITDFAKQEKISLKKMNEWAESFATLDNKLTKPQLLENLTLQRKEVYCSRKMYHTCNKAKTTLRLRLEDLSKKNEILVQENKVLVQEKQDLVEKFERNETQHNQIVEDLRSKLRKAVARKTTGNLCDTNQAIKLQIQEKAKTFLWTQCKFIQSADEEVRACKTLLKIGMFDNELVNTKQKRANLVETYKTYCKRSLFMKRNYVTSEVKKMIERRMNAGEHVLTMEELIMCLSRDIKCEQDMSNFMIYWEDYLPREVGSLEWSEKEKYYVTISKAMRKDNTELAMITPQAEAFLVLCVQNGMSRWKREFERKQAKKEGRELPVTDQDELDQSSGKYDGIFTNTKQGQNLWGGWCAGGLELFLAYKAKNIQARNRPDNAQLEKDCLARLRQERGIDVSCTSALDHLKNKEAKKRLAKRGRGDEPLPPKKKVIHTMDEIESSEDEDEE
jgi:hypothetical protein